jgi:Mrp family chromosome partitioning ATPase
MTVASGNLLEAKQSPPDLVTLFECIWRFKWKALFSGVLCAGLFGAVAFLVVPARFKATSLVRLAAPDGLVERPSESSNAQSGFRNTQAELLRMPHVLKRALEAPAVKVLGELKTDPEGIEELNRWLVVELPRTTEIMRISVEHNRADLAFVLANAITDAYLNETHRGAEEEVEKKLAALSVLQSDAEDRLAKSWAELQTLAKQLGAGDPASASLQAQAEVENYRDYARRLREVQAEKRESERQVRMIRSNPEGLTQEMQEGNSTVSVRYAMFLAKLKREKAMSKWGPNHPEVRAAEMEENLLAQYYQKTSAEAAAPKKSQQEQLLAEPLATISRLGSEEQALETAMREIEQRREILGGDNVAKLEIVRNGIQRVEQLSDRLWQTRETLEVERHADQRVQLVAYATLPLARDSSKRNKLTIVMAAGGFGLAILLLAASEFATGRLHSQRDFVRRTEIEVLGSLPALPANITDGHAILDPKARRLRVKLDMLAGVLTNHPRIPDARVFMVTSAVDRQERDGVAMHFAAALARMAKKTVLVNLDLRGDERSSHFARESSVGVVELVSGKPAESQDSAAPAGVASLPHEEIDASNRSLVPAANPDLYRRSLAATRGQSAFDLHGLDLETGISNLDFVPAGGVIEEPLPLITDLRLRELVDELKRDYTYVVLDVAAAASFPDAVHMAWLADVAVLSVRRNISDTNSIMEAQARLIGCGLPVFGLMIA